MQTLTSARLCFWIQALGLCMVPCFRLKTLNETNLYLVYFGLKLNAFWFLNLFKVKQIST
jgi:hypothetical protein